MAKALDPERIPARETYECGEKIKKPQHNNGHPPGTTVRGLREASAPWRFSYFLRGSKLLLSNPAGD
jgi:hypothetical protein